MAFIVNDRVKESSSTTGTGAFTLSGAASNYLTFNVGVGVGSHTWYCINNLGANEWEVGFGQLTGATTLTRVYVTAGTSGTSLVNFSAGTKEVFVTQPSDFNAQTLGRTNMIINPHGSIQQETTAVLTSTGYYADQWATVITGASLAAQTGVTTGTVSSYDPSYMFTKTTTAKGSLAAGDIVRMAQPIEGNYTRRLLYGGSSAKGSWLRWRASASQSGTASVSLRNAAVNRSFVQSFAVSTTPTDYFLYVPGDTTGTWPTDSAKFGELNFCFASGTTSQTSTLGAWQAGDFLAANTQSNMLDTVNRQLNITDVQWSQSKVLLPFEPVDYQQELARCQRYWISSYPLGTTPGSIETASPLFRTMETTQGFQMVADVSFKSTMRASPTVTIYGSETGTAGKISSSSAGDFDGQAVSSSIQGTMIRFLGSVPGTAQDVRCHYVANARM